MSAFTRPFKARRSSGLDFQDRGPPVPEPESTYDQHIDLGPTNGAVHLKRNRSERTRLQSLVRSAGIVAPTSRAMNMNLKDRFNHWMINEGGRTIFLSVWVLVHALVFAFGFMNYEIKDNLTNARHTFGITYAIARSAALVLHLDVALILLPICRNFISTLRRTPLNKFIPFDKNVTFHKATAWSMVFFTLLHILAHMVNFYKLAMTDTNKGGGGKFVAFLGANFATGPGATGWLMTLLLSIIVYFAIEKRRRKNFEAFWYTHHLFILFFVLWQLHGMFCMIKPDRPPFCSANSIGVFWRYWLVGGLLFIFERILREVRSRHRTYISKVIQHPSKVVEVQIKKDKITTRAGQYVFLNCPDVSYFQWHPFTLTSAPEEDYISLHIRVAGDFTSAFASALGCDFDSKREKDVGSAGKVVPPPLNKVLPRVMIDGPFGSASEDFLNYETVMLVGAGIGVTPFASILKNIWYRMNSLHNSKPTRLSKVYFTWVIRDFGAAEWFHSLLHAIEEQDSSGRIEINIYLTAKIGADDMNNIIVSDVGADQDAITSLRAPTHFGRPNWDSIFSTMSERHPETDVGVFFCGPPVLSKQLHAMSNKYSDPRPKGTRFFFGKENF